jgi:hypothetical protein
VLKIVADGWKTRPAGGRVPPRSLISLPKVEYATGYRASAVMMPIMRITPPENRARPAR